MRAVTIGVSLLGLAFAASVDEHGTWAFSPSDQASKITFILVRSGPGGHSSDSSSDWLRSDFPPVDWSNGQRHDVQFTLSRDAGQIACEGMMKNAEGSGFFTFHPNGEFPARMKAIGFSGFDDEDKQFAAALHNVSLAFAREMKAENLSGLDGNQLIAFRIFGVNHEFIEQMRGAGVEERDADKLVAFRIHGVTPEFVHAIEHLGYPHPEPDKLIALRIHGVTPEYIQTMQARGLENLTLDKLVSMRIFGVN